jgi:hypothetical protein
MAFTENNNPVPGDTDNNLLRKILNSLISGGGGGGGGGGGVVSGSVAINDGTTAANKAVVTNATPGGSDFGLVVRVAGDTGGAVTIVDGGDVTQGAKADALTTNPVGSFSIVSILKGILAESVSAVGTYLPGIATETTLLAIDTKLGARLPVLGQAAMAASQPVVIASDQTAVAGNITLIAGSAVTANTGNAAAGTPRVVIATDQPSFTNPVPIKPGGGTLTDRSGTIATGATQQQLAASNSSRKYLLIQNNSSETLWFNFTTNAVTSQPSLSLLPGQSFVQESGYVSTELISIIGASTGSAFSAKEG